MKKKLSKKEVIKYFKDAEARAMAKIKARMEILAKDDKLRKQMEKDIKNA